MVWLSSSSSPVPDPVRQARSSCLTSARGGVHEAKEEADGWRAGEGPLDGRSHDGAGQLVPACVVRRPRPQVPGFRTRHDQRQEGTVLVDYGMDPKVGGMLGQMMAQPMNRNMQAGNPALQMQPQGPSNIGQSGQ